MDYFEFFERVNAKLQQYKAKLTKKFGQELINNAMIWFGPKYLDAQASVEQGRTTMEEALRDLQAKTHAEIESKGKDSPLGKALTCIQHEIEAEYKNVRE